MLFRNHIRVLVPTRSLEYHALMSPKYTYGSELSWDNNRLQHLLSHVGQVTHVYFGKHDGKPQVPVLPIWNSSHARVLWASSQTTLDVYLPRGLSIMSSWSEMDLAAFHHVQYIFWFVEMFPFTRMCECVR